MMEYKAIDGRFFETEEECKEYESNPVIWIIESRYPMALNSEIDKIFLLKSDAEKYIEEQDIRRKCGFSYYCKPFVVEPYKPTPKPQTTVFNTTKPYVDSKENKEERLSVWDKIKKVLKGYHG